MKRLRLVFPLILLATCLSCGRPDQSPTETGEQGGTPARGDWAIVQYSVEPENLNYTISQTAPADYALHGPNNSFIQEALLQYDTKTWEFNKPLLAESMPEVSEDHLIYTFTLRDGVKWHDGQPFTPEDVLFSAKALMCPLVDSAAQRSEFTDLTNVEVLEGRKVRFTFRKPYFQNLEVIGGDLPIQPKHVMDEKGLLDDVKFTDIIGPKGRTEPKIKEFADRFNKHPMNRAPVGTGPYKFEKWDSGKEIVVVRNEDYWGPKPYLDKVILRFIIDPTAALTALKAGDVDMVPRLSAVQYAQQTSGPAFDQQFAKNTYTIPQFYYIGWNEERPFFRDKRVRQALTMLLDREQIIQTLRFGLGKIAANPFHGSSPDNNQNIKALPYDPQKAQQLLDEAGWKDHDGDGVRDKDGVPFRFEFLGSVGSAFSDQLLPIVKESFRKAGIDVIERKLEFTIQIERLKDHQFDASTSAWVTGLVQDPYQVWHSSSIANRGSNYISFRNAESDKLLETARVEFDTEKRRQLYWRWQELIADEQPYTLLLYPVEAAAYSKRFQNVDWLPVRPGYDLTQWYVPKMTQKYTAAAAQ
jgi:peptide/nickel transport system substrate-binding protein